jgi:CRISPR/Cas system-associated protein Csm6
MGRPKKPEGEVRENFLRIRLTDAERAALDNEARARGEETSTWARRTLLALARPLPKQR